MTDERRRLRSAGWFGKADRDGDAIDPDVAARRLRLDVADDELERRRAAWTPASPGRATDAPGPPDYTSSRMSCNGQRSARSNAAMTTRSTLQPASQ